MARVPVDGEGLRAAFASDDGAAAAALVAGTDEMMRYTYLLEAMKQGAPSCTRALAQCSGGWSSKTRGFVIREAAKIIAKNPASAALWHGLVEGLGEVVPNEAARLMEIFLATIPAPADEAIASEMLSRLSVPPQSAQEVLSSCASPRFFERVLWQNVLCEDKAVYERAKLRYGPPSSSAVIHALGASRSDLGPAAPVALGELSMPDQVEVLLNQGISLVQRHAATGLFDGWLSSLKELPGARELVARNWTRLYKGGQGQVSYAQWQDLAAQLGLPEERPYPGFYEIKNLVSTWGNNKDNRDVAFIEEFFKGHASPQTEETLGPLSNALLLMIHAYKGDPAHPESHGSYREAIRWLLEHGANPDMQTANGESFNKVRKELSPVAEARMRVVWDDYVLSRTVAEGSQSPRPRI